MTVARTIKRFTIATAGVGLAFTLVAGPAGADVGAPEPEPIEVKIILSNAVITGVVEATAEPRTENISLSFPPTIRVKAAPLFAQVTARGDA